MPTECGFHEKSRLAVVTDFQDLLFSIQSWCIRTLLDIFYQAMRFLGLSVPLPIRDVQVVVKVKKSHFEKLPDDVLEQVANLLSCGDMVRMVVACRHTIQVRAQCFRREDLVGRFVRHIELDVTQLSEREQIELLKIGELFVFRLDLAKKFQSPGFFFNFFKAFQNNPTDLQIQTLVRYFPKLNTLNLNYWQLTKGNLQALIQLPLKTLRVRACQLTDELCQELGKMPLLENLDVSDNEALTDKAMDGITKCTKLTMLNLSGCRHITNKALEEIPKLPDLQELNVRDCEITDQGLDALEGNTKLRHLRLRSCQRGEPKITEARLQRLEAHNLGLQISFESIFLS